MKKLSSDSIRLHKILFPSIWFTALAGFTLTYLKHGSMDRGLLLVLLGMTLLGTLIMKHVLWDLVDEAHDAGDHILVRKGKVEERIALANIDDVTFHRMRPPRITLHLRQAGGLGARVAFSPLRGTGFNPFAKHPVAEDLGIRARKARNAAL